MMIIFSGRRWVIQEVFDRDKVILVVASKGGNPPKFGGDPGDIHDRVIERMFGVLEGDIAPTYIDQTARDFLDEARRQYARLGFATSPMVRLRENSIALATRVGTVKTTTLMLALRRQHFVVEAHDGFVTVQSKDKSTDLFDALGRIATGEKVSLFNDQSNLIFEKFDPYLTRELLERDALSSRVDAESVSEVCKRLLTETTHQLGFLKRFADR